MAHMDSPVDMEISDGSISNSSDMEIEDPNEEVTYVMNGTPYYDHASNPYSANMPLTSSSSLMSQHGITSEQNLMTPQNYSMPSLTSYIKSYHNGYQSRQRSGMRKVSLEQETGHAMRDNHYHMGYPSQVSNALPAQKATGYSNNSSGYIQHDNMSGSHNISIAKTQGNEHLQRMTGKSGGIYFDSFDDSDSDESFTTAPGSPIHLAETVMDFKHGNNVSSNDNADPEVQLEKCQQELQLLDERKKEIEKAKNKLSLDMLGLQVKLSIERNRKNKPTKKPIKSKKAAFGSKYSAIETIENGDEKKPSVEKHDPNGNAEPFPGRNIETHEHITTQAPSVSLKHISAATIQQSSLPGPAISPSLPASNPALQPLTAVQRLKPSQAHASVEKASTNTSENITLTAKRSVFSAAAQSAAIPKKPSSSISKSTKQKVPKTLQASIGALEPKLHIPAPQPLPTRDALPPTSVTKLEKKAKHKQINDAAITVTQGQKPVAQSQIPSTHTMVDKQSAKILKKDPPISPTKTNENNKGAFRPYRSPLDLFGIQAGEEKRDIARQPTGPRPDTVYKSFCAFEANGGTCNDDTCTAMHFRDF
ncbi:hypothetical protein EC973_002229 [Apophysomyces ossiformis]|uniref:Putative zinc-finger domain-containing protein n=1 Tax=Apophysomyces ossiformis TaxID=679940 RepID=A0A8H7ES15_9FUNG|nr:hypothetical protein EC973_002229 [Apophysomyces ossiformis]